MAILNALSNTFRSIRNQVNATPATLFIVIFQIGLIVNFSLIFPFLVRHFLAVPFVELNEPLEFTFQTCTDSLHGICSFPEAEVVFDERNIEFEGGYRYRFRLELQLLEPELLQSTGLFLTQVELRDSTSKALSVIKKTVKISSAGLYGWYIWLRNWIFLPLYIIGFIGDGGLNNVVVDFPSDYVETFSRPAKFLVVQIQNRFIQVSSASLRVRANIGYAAYLINTYPIITYLLLSGISLVILFTIFTIYWATQGFQMYQRIVDNNKNVRISNKDHSS